MEKENERKDLSGAAARTGKGNEKRKNKLYKKCEKGFMENM